MAKDTPVNHVDEDSHPDLTEAQRNQENSVAARLARVEAEVFGDGVDSDKDDDKSSTSTSTTTKKSGGK